MKCVCVCGVAAGLDNSSTPLLTAAFPATIVT